MYKIERKAIAVHKEIYEKVRKSAEKNYRTICSQINFILDDYFKNHPKETE